MLTGRILCLLFIIVTVVTVVFSQPKICSNMTQFQQCVDNGRYKISVCSQKVVTVPTYEYYECQCTEYLMIQTCYTYCPDDPQLQLQLLTEKSVANSVCSQMDMMKTLNMGPPIVTMTTSLVKVPTTVTGIATISISIIGVTSTTTVSSSLIPSSKTNINNVPSNLPPSSPSPVVSSPPPFIFNESFANRSVDFTIYILIFGFIINIYLLY